MLEARARKNLMLFQFLAYWAVGAYAAQDMGTPEYGTMLLARSHSLAKSSAAKPFMPFSFNLGRDMKVAHLRLILEILKKDVELLLLESNTLSDLPLRVKEVLRDEVHESVLHEVYISLSMYRFQDL